jgi:hypothetical protein
MIKPQGFGTAALATIGAVTIACYAASAGIATPNEIETLGSATSAHISRALKTTDEAQMRYVKHRSSSSRLFEEGTVHGTLPGSMDAYCSLGATFSASFTIHTTGGTIEGRGTATPHAGGGLYESFAGTLTVTGGTGRYARAHGHGGLYGTFDRRTYALTVQTTGSLSY